MNIPVYDGVARMDGAMVDALFRDTGAELRHTREAAVKRIKALESENAALRAKLLVYEKGKAT